MMQRTGNARIDNLIEGFLDHVIEGSTDSCHHGEQVRVADLAYRADLAPNDQPAAGWCGAVTRHFHHHAGGHTTDDDICGHVAMHGYHDMPYGPLGEYGDPVNQDLSALHCANVIIEGEHAYLIDFSAAQYGYDVLPMVRRTTRELGRSFVVMGNDIGPGAWEIEWDMGQAAA